MQPAQDTEFNSQISTSSAQLHCNIITAKPHQSYKNDLIYIAVCGDVFLEDKVTSALNIAEVFNQNNNDIDVLYQKLSGQFWLIVFDKVNDNLYLLNDHFGMKSCFYTVQNNTLYISDSLKKLKNVNL